MQAQLVNTQGIKDAPKPERRCKIRVEIESLAQGLPSGHYARKGDEDSCTVIIYKSDLQKTLDLVEPAYSDHPEMLEAAETAFQTSLTNLFKQKLGDQAVFDEDGKPTRTYLLKENDAERKRIADTFHESVQSHFLKHHGRSLKPLRSVEIVEKDIAPPEGSNPAAETSTQITEVVTAVIQALAANGVIKLPEQATAPTPTAAPSARKAKN